MNHDAPKINLSGFYKQMIFRQTIGVKNNIELLIRHRHRNKKGQIIFNITTNGLPTPRTIYYIIKSRQGSSSPLSLTSAQGRLGKIASFYKCLLSGNN